MGAPIRKSGSNIAGRPQDLALLQEAGCDCAILTNNHTYDYGDGALFATLYCPCWCREGPGRRIPGLAGRENGIRMSVVAVCENGFGMAGEHAPGTAGSRADLLTMRLRDEHAVSDFAIVVAHGGCQFNPLPSPGQKERYRWLTLLGRMLLSGEAPIARRGMS